MKSEEIIVSISCLAFNHGPYIRQCLEGFMMQETNFSFEVLIHDDASTDDTSKIIKEYEKRYPDVIKPIYQKVNQYSQGIKPTLKYNFPRAQGKYIALCEGDDYWTDRLKLQKQVDFLEQNPSFSLCFHDSRVVYLNKKRRSHSFCRLDKRSFTIEDVIANRWFVPTQSIVFRADIKINAKWLRHIYNRDYALQLLCVYEGPFHYIPEIMSVYRKHNGGIRTRIGFKGIQVEQKIIEILHYFNIHTEFRYNEIISQRIKEIEVQYYYLLLNKRPTYVKYLSIDYYIYAFNYLLSKCARK